MKLTKHVSRIKTIRQSDKDFIIIDGLVMSPRAGFEINPKCPKEYRQVLTTAIDLGWIKPVAHMLDSEAMWERLME